MYPNLYYVFRDWFGVEWHALQYLNTFGLLVAFSFLGAAWTLRIELRRMEKNGVLQPTEETVIVGAPASLFELLTNGLLGFLFGFKIIGLLWGNPDGLSAADYIFSANGHWLGGLLLGAGMAYLKWSEKNKHVLKTPEKRVVRIWPHDRIGDIVMYALVFGILGAKLFDNFEHWDQFIADPIGQLFSASGLTFYGGLIVASVAVILYARKHRITIRYLIDAAAPGLMLAYAIGRLGCQLSGDGDWGIYNSAYVSDPYGKVVLADTQHTFRAQLEKNKTYFLSGSAADTSGSAVGVTDRTYTQLDRVPHLSVKAPSFLPVELFAYTYPGNVNKDGILIPGNTDEHNRVLPAPVFPTPLYETIICMLLFFVLWWIRRITKYPAQLFGCYLIMNGLERFLIEWFRVNETYLFLGIRFSQAQLIAMSLMTIGIVVVLFAKRFKPDTNNESK
jgi:phosphatidylglycerol:prolipoprotein diacylglycerol transferase